MSEHVPPASSSPPRHDWAMTEDEVSDESAVAGCELEERACQDAWVSGWARGDDRRWLCFLERHQAVDWMRDWLSRGQVFA
jgi:hypothetical protein